MSMDLWYELAARELPDSDEDLIEKLELGDAQEPEGEAGPDDLGAVDFF